MKWLGVKKESPGKQSTTVEVDLGPNDILVVEYPNRISREQYERIKAKLLVALNEPGKQLILFEDGATYSIIRREMGYEEKQILIEAVIAALEAAEGVPLKPHEARRAAEIAAEYMLEDDDD